MSSCSDTETWISQEGAAGQTIKIGGIDTDEMQVSVSPTRALTGVDAETVPWLLQPLKNGLDITYGLNGQAGSVAILKLKDTNAEVTTPDYDTENGLAVYTFKYRQAEGEGSDALWSDNGYHFFQGVHVPERIRYTTAISEVEGTGKAPALTTDQHDGTDTGTDDQLGNYTLLTHYLGMPANFKVTATIERIKLPFRHRLARVVAFVLIDPVLGTTLKGYKKNAEGQAVADEDATTTSFRFGNVDVLQGVKDHEESNHHHTLTPVWTTARKVIPHFIGELGSVDKQFKPITGCEEHFYMFYQTAKKKFIFPTSGSEWTNARTAWQAKYDASKKATEAEKEEDANTASGYVRTDYRKAPAYDIIVRPTYTRADSVMYDEYLDGKTPAQFAQATNKIDFELELENGLVYTKRFEFDLNANYQTVVYLRVAREHVDYNDAGSTLWVEQKESDGWYGVNNLNGNTLSKAGSSWQRAYTVVDSYFSETGTWIGDNGVVYPNGVTDGQFYNADKNDNDNAQYYTDTHQDKWLEKFLQAYEGGAHHGDYFILKKNITIDASQLPLDFVFTGHLDAQDHTITLTGTGDWAECSNEVLGKLYQSRNDDDKVPQLYVVNEIAQSPGRKIASRVIEFGEPEEVDMNATKPGDLNPELTYLYKEGDEYMEYTNRAFYKKTPGFLFAGLNGTYLTRQEEEENAGRSIYNQDWSWEANVHKETNKMTTWVPTAGYRAEVINVKVASPATLFKDDATITGNVQNCWNGTTAVPNHTPAIPQYK